MALTHHKELLQRSNVNFCVPEIIVDDVTTPVDVIKSKFRAHFIQNLLTYFPNGALGCFNIWLKVSSCQSTVRELFYFPVVLVDVRPSRVLASNTNGFIISSTDILIGSNFSSQRIDLNILSRIRISASLIFDHALVDSTTFCIIFIGEEIRRPTCYLLCEL